MSDPVIQKEDGQWLYTFASSVDDSEMAVTDIVRGADHVTNTATQIQIIRALGAEPPRFAHEALLVGSGAFVVEEWNRGEHVERRDGDARGF